MSKFLIDISSAYSQKFTCVLSSQKMQFTFAWSEIAKGWIYSVTKNDILLCEGRVARLNVDLFASIKYEVSGSLKLEGNVPTKSNLGTECLLYFYSESINEFY